jgi:hypothetical protein
MLVNKRK